jgi:hypothetical protein
MNVYKSVQSGKLITSLKWPSAIKYNQENMMSKKNRKKYRNKIAAAIRTDSHNPSSPVMSRSAEFNPDYSYVIKDLKRIGSLALFFLGVLVVLSFILR